MRLIAALQFPNLSFKHSRTHVAVWVVLVLNLFVCADCKHNAASNITDNEAVRRERGEQVVAEYLKRDAAPYRKNHVRLAIAGPNEPSKTYELEISRKQTPSETLTLTHVIQPVDESDLAALSIERKGQPTVNVTYVSSTDQFRETGTNKMFFGGLTAQELLGEWDKYTYRLLSEKDDGGVQVYEVEGSLKPGNDSTIARSTTVFRGDTYLPVEMHLFDSDGKELRVFNVKKFDKSGARDVISRTEIDNLVRQTKITIETLGLEFPEKMDDSMFTKEHLKQVSQRRSGGSL